MTLLIMPYPSALHGRPCSSTGISSLPSTTLHKAPLSLSSIPISRVVFDIHNRRPFRDVAADPDNPSSRVFTDADLLFYSPRFILFILRLDINIISSRTL